MTLPRSAADVLADHVLFEIEAIDRMYLNLYQPRLQHGAEVAAFFVGHRGHRFASSALMAPATSRNEPPTPNLTHQEHDHKVKPSSLRFNVSYACGLKSGVACVL